MTIDRFPIRVRVARSLVLRNPRSGMTVRLFDSAVIRTSCTSVGLVNGVEGSRCRVRTALRGRKRRIQAAAGRPAPYLVCRRGRGTSCPVPPCAAGSVSALRNAVPRFPRSDPLRRRRRREDTFTVRLLVSRLFFFPGPRSIAGYIVRAATPRRRITSELLGSAVRPPPSSMHPDREASLFGRIS